MSTPAPPVTRHGVFMRVWGLGVLLTGDSGVGKSELALELLARGHPLVADDATEFVRQGPHVIGHCPEVISGFLEARSLGILNIRKIFRPRSVIQSAALGLMIALDPPPDPERPWWSDGMERIMGRRETVRLCGVDLPRLSIPIRVGHNLAVLVETACRDQQIRNGGYRADRDFAARQLRAIRQTQSDLPPETP